MAGLRIVKTVATNCQRAQRSRSGCRLRQRRRNDLAANSVGAGGRVTVRTDLHRERLTTKFVLVVRRQNS